MLQALLSLVDFGNRLGVFAYWFMQWIYRFVLIALLGGLTGLILTPVLKLLFFSNRECLWLAKQAFITGFQYFGIWAGGVALVWLVMDRKRVVRGLQSLLSNNN